MTQRIQAPKGTRDILPSETALWAAVEATARSVFGRYGFREIRTPIFEETELFTRGVGESSDIVGKEMYSFVDKGERHLTLRPENTASVVRAYVEHGMHRQPQPVKLFYIGPQFRYERPQKGRYRQFHQIGVEALGFAGPDIDAEQILMGQRLWDDLGLEGIHLEINTLGQLEERQQHRTALIQHFERHAAALDADAQRRLHSNPLRILDSKNPAMQEIVEAAPRLMDYLGEASLKHFEEVQGLLKDAGIACRINPRLVRGLDYYNLTVFEWITDRLGAQGTVCAGGRYDGLVAQLGGKPAPACGFAIGMERILALWQEQGGAATAMAAPDVYLVHQGAAAQRQAFLMAEALRSQGFSVQLHCGGGSFKAQMKRADASGATLALILGEDEVAAAEVTVKTLREGGMQQRVAVDRLPEVIGQLFFGREDEDGGL